MKHLSNFLQDSRGGIIIAFAITLPVLLLAVGMAIDYGFLSLQKKRLQSAVDAAAVAAASELHVISANTSVAESVALNVLKGNLGESFSSVEMSTQFSSEPSEPPSVTVQAFQDAELIFPIELQGRHGTKLSARATARVLGNLPLCVLGLDDKNAGITLQQRARLTGIDCGVYANSKKSNAILSNGGSLLRAGLICSVGGVVGGSGNFEPQPLTDCPPVQDPLAGRAAPRIGACGASDLKIGVDGELKIDGSYISKRIKIEVEEKRGKVVKNGRRGHRRSRNEVSEFNVTIGPGVYCGGLKIGGAARVRLLPGVYVMQDGPLFVSEYATLEGEHVGFYFNGKESNFYFGAKTTVSLTAPKDGPMAGLLTFEDRKAPKLRPFAIFSDNARVLVGTIYLPRSQLYIDADSPVADESAYTAIIVRRLELFEGPHLVLNTNYDDTDVPVPSGITAMKQKVILAE